MTDQKKLRIVDVAAVVAPLLAALSSAAGAAAGFGDHRVPALTLSIIGAVASAGAVLLTNWASRLRDKRLEEINSTARTAQAFAIMGL